MYSDVLIIGGGHAGAMAAITLRQKKFTGTITIIEAQHRLPYQRPPLSKGFLAGTTQENRLYFKSLDFYKKNQINILIGSSVLFINKKKKTIELSNKKKINYQNLVFATGSRLKKIKFSCSEEHIYYLNNLDRSIQIKSSLNKKENILIIGAGYIGLEIASTLIKKDLSVTIVESEDRVMKRSVCKETSEYLRKKHKENGIEFIFNSKIDDIQDHENVKRVVTNQGIEIDVDAVIIGVGVLPKTDLAEDIGLNVENGIMVDDNCQSSSENIFAIGDCANQFNYFYKRRLRIESVHNATEQAKTLAEHFTGVKRSSPQVPWFWSDQYDLKIHTAGISDGNDEYFIQKKDRNGDLSVFYFKNSKLIAVDTINDIKSFNLGKKLINSGYRLPHRNFNSKEFNIQSLLD